MAGYGGNFPSYAPYPAYQNNSYQQQYSQAGAMQNPYQTQPQSYAAQQQPVGIVWVDGEVGAKAYQLPAGWPVNAPMPLWDTNDTIIYLKSTNQMGMPNPIQKVRYTMEEQPRVAPAMQSNQAMLPGSGSYQEGQQTHQDMSQYVRRDELEQMKDELKGAISALGAETKGARNNGKSSV